MHVFDRACNLINEHREVLSVVTPQIGEGPFNLVVEDVLLFSDDLDIESSVSVGDRFLRLGNLRIHLANATLWDPRPAWERLHTRKDDILHQLAQVPIPNSLEGPHFYPPINQPSELYHSRQPTQSLLSNLCSSLVTASRASVRKYASRLAGVGIGLTPSGDDFLMGAVYAAWIIHPFEIASVLARDIASTTTLLTTSLSAEWLKAAGRGEAGIRWHEFFDALLSGDLPAMRKTVENILAIGETSGADALAGYQSTTRSWAELQPARPR